MLKLIPCLALIGLAGCSTVKPGPTAATNPPVYSTPAPSGTVVLNEGDELVLSKEVLSPTKSAGHVPVKIRKVITTHTENVTVPVRVETYEIVKVTPTNQVPDFTPKEVSVQLLNEGASPAVVQQVVEVVRLQKVVTTENRTVQANLRTESYEIVK